MRGLGSFWLTIVLLGSTYASIYHGTVEAAANAHEPVLLEALDLAQTGRVDEALTVIKRLVDENPKFRLAQVIYGDLLLAKVQPIEAFGNLAIISDQLRTGLKDEAAMKLRFSKAPPEGDQVPDVLIQMPSDQKWAIVVDTSMSRLYLFDISGERPDLVSDHYITIGRNGALKTREGDKKTPLGVYFVTRRISPKFLDDFYGTGALPINYPNEWDSLLNRTGYGIWLHGVSSKIYNRFPNASDGCIALANTDLSTIWDRSIDTNTPVIITEGLSWISHEVMENRRKEFLEVLERWRKDWQSMDMDKYMGHYSLDFRNDKNQTYDQWEKRKTRINGPKTFIEVNLSNINFYSYPAETDLLVVNFDQGYKSNNYSSESTKRQYWKREADGSWRIVYEGQAQFRDIHIKGIPPSART